MHFRKAVRPLLAPSLLTLALPVTLAACTTTAPPPMAESTLPAAPDLSALVDKISIRHEIFKLENGLTTIVHTDRKAPLVGVTVYYRVGSKHEPRGRTGFAHLFEHLMFVGSENVPNFDIPLEAAGSNGADGSTLFDRTNYIQTVPTGALDLALFMESDRMGYLLGAVTQEKLDNQRMVVQNEKRQYDNRPFGLENYKLSEGLFPVGHPYRHSLIGSMADLEAASISDVRSWFTDNYGPNNVVLALTGDIDLPTARTAVERWFGDIPRGPDVVQQPAAPVTLAAPLRSEMTDQVPATRILKAWSSPGLNDADAEALEVGMHILGGLISSRLNNSLVRRREVATRVSGSAYLFEQVGILETYIDVRPGGDAAAAEALFDAEIARLLRDGPNTDEVSRAATQLIATEVGALQRVGGFSGKGKILAEGLLYTGDANYYRRRLDTIAAATPADVQAAMKRWLGRPSYTLTIVPGERTEDGALLGGWGDEATTPAPLADARKPLEVTRTAPPRQAPPVIPVGALTFPDVQTAQLSNGLRVRLARREVVPQVSMAMTFEAGLTADTAADAGTQSLMLDMLQEGTTNRSAEQIASDAEALGASISTELSPDMSSIRMTALAARLGPSLELLADIVRNPAFTAPDFTRVKTRRLAAIEEIRSDPSGLADQAFYSAIYGNAHPYGIPSAGTASTIGALTPSALSAEHRRWIRPENATLTVVGDVTMDELIRQLESTLGDWVAPTATLAGTRITATPPVPRSRLIVVDRPNSPSSTLYIGRVTSLTAQDKSTEAIELANEVLGSGILSRLNAELRETKGWTYNIYSTLPNRRGNRPLVIATQVQADRTGDSILTVLDLMKGFPGRQPVTEAELQRVTDGNVRNLPNRYETNNQVLAALLENQLMGRDDDYQERLGRIWGAVDADAINAAAALHLKPQDLTIVVVGDRKIIEDQLSAIGIDAEFIAASNL
jgi:zinc protease